MSSTGAPSRRSDVSEKIGVGVELAIPPDKQEKAAQTVLELAQLLALDWAAWRSHGGTRRLK